MPGLAPSARPEGLHHAPSGAGRMAEALARHWVAAGHDMMIRGRTPSKAHALAEHLAATTGARVVKALHQVHFHVWQQRARYDDRPLVVPIAGDADAKEIVAPLVRDAGAEPLDAGGLEQAHNLEAMAAVIIRLLWNGAPPLSAFQLTVGEPTSPAPAGAAARSATAAPARSDARARA